MVARLEVHRELPPRAWQAESVYYGYYLRNPRRRSSGLGIRLCEINPRAVENAEGYCVHLPPRSVFRAGSRLAALRRGRIELEGIELASRFPFGLTMVSKEFDQPASLVIWPAKGALRTDLLRRGAMESSSAKPGRLQGGQDEFFGLREYRQGDNPRWIHWRRSAGRTVPVVREMAHPVPDVLFVVVDVRREGGRPVHPEEPRERRLRFAATLIDDACRRGYQVGLAAGTPGGAGIFPPAAGRGPRRDVLDALADVHDTVRMTPDEVIAAIPPETLINAQCVLLLEKRDDVSALRAGQLKLASRNLQVLCDEDLHSLFDDNPAVARKEDSPCL
jgi:uncharacterized protein (DUF58 family)